MSSRSNKISVSKKFAGFFRFYGFFLLLITCNVVFWFNTKHIRPELGVVPSVPGKEELALLKMGDDQFYFRILALQMQNTGDTYGRFTPLKHYDMGKIRQWFTLLDALDPISDMLPTMAAYYYSQTQNQQDVRPLVDYLYEHSIRNVERKWWWLLQSIYLAQYKLKDMDLALKVSKPLMAKSVPIWAQQMVAVVHEKRGEMEDALGIMEAITETLKKDDQAIPERDLRYMEYFIKERLARLDKLKELKDLKTTDEQQKYFQPKF